MNIQQVIHQYFYPFYIRRWAERFREVKRGQIVVDAGSYLGGFTFYAAKKVGQTGKVIAFEPDPKNFKMLKKRVEGSNFKNIILVNKALGNNIKEIELESDNHFSSIVIKTLKRPTFMVQQTTLDNEMENLGIGKVDFIKVNIEGAEIETIKGAKKTLSHTNHLAISCHVVEGRNTAIIIKPMLEESGFKVKVLKRKRLIIDLGHIDVYGSRKVSFSPFGRENRARKK